MRSVVVGLVLGFCACTGDLDSGDPVDSGSPSGADGGVPTGEPDPIENARQFCVDETNRYRMQHGRAVLVRSSQLEAYADQGALISHEGGAPHQHFLQTQGGGVAFAENEFPRASIASFGNGDLSELVRFWIRVTYEEGPGGGHYENLLHPSARRLGCGIHVRDGDATIIQDFGA
jgi:hypothetical protein